MISNTISRKGNWNVAMADSRNDEPLVKRLAAGDESALNELYEEYGKRMYAYALRLTNDPDKAEDVLQDVLVTVWRKASSYRGEGRFIAWLLGIVHHTSMNAMRHVSIPLSDEMEESLPSPAGSPESQTQQEQQNAWVREGLQSMSPEHRAVLELVFYHGLSLEEVSQVCQCPLGTVKSRLAYARQHLKGILMRENAEEWR